MLRTSIHMYFCVVWLLELDRKYAPRSMCDVVRFCIGGHMAVVGRAERAPSSEQCTQVKCNVVGAMGISGMEKVKPIFDLWPNLVKETL